MSHSTVNPLSHLDIRRGSIEHLSHLLGVTERLVGIVSPLHQQYTEEGSSVLHQVGSRQGSGLSSEPSESFSDDINANAISREHVEADRQSLASSRKSAFAPQAKTSIWNREGFTPIPQEMDQSSESALSEVNHEPERAISPQSPVMDTPSVELSSEPLTASRAQVLENIEAFDEPLLQVGSETEEAFIPIAERLHMSTRSQSDLAHDEPDSSVPQPLEALYDELSPGPQGLLQSVNAGNGEVESRAPLIPLRVTPPPFDPELHAVVAPAPLEMKRKSTLPMVLLVSIVCLVLGGLLAFTFLHELATFIK